MEKINFNAIPARALNYSIRLLLGKYLNPEMKMLSSNDYARDYRGLAEQMQFSFDDIRNFERQEDPTMKILDEWTVQPDATIGKLIQFLENMGRHHVIQDLEKHFENDAKVYLQNQEREKESPLQVPEVTSCPYQTSQMNELNILTREDAFTGEPTYYDAFISYAHEDFQFVYNLVRYLEANGFKLFIRSRDLLAGHFEYETDMQLIQERCKRVLIVLSPNFIKCPACEVQARFAASLGYAEKCRKIIPILWKPCNIPVSLRYVSKIDFTKPGIQDWIWETLKSSLRDYPTLGGFIPSEKLEAQRRTGLPQLESSSPDTSNPAITFPPTASYSLNSDTSLSPCTSSVELVQDENLNDTIATNAKSSVTSRQMGTKFRHFFHKKSAKKGDTDFSSASISSSSNATSGFHSQSSSDLESIGISNDHAEDTRV